MRAAGACAGDRQGPARVALGFFDGVRTLAALRRISVYFVGDDGSRSRVGLIAVQEEASANGIRSQATRFRLMTSRFQVLQWQPRIDDR
jgi:hypothetical protein